MDDGGFKLYRVVQEMQFTLYRFIRKLQQKWMCRSEKLLQLIPTLIIEYNVHHMISLGYIHLK